MLNTGVKLGTYEITGAIGAGGMGEVYVAHDSKLGRDVAIKILPEAFAHDPDRLARFQREAKLLASLNHPNIATIHDLEDSSGMAYLVMELVPGDTLADRIKRDGPVPLEESLAIAKQIADALEAAHEKGVIHRDLKPANVKLTPDGKVKVLDFGLAKAFADESFGDPANSPTLSNAATMQGLVLGTAAYMSPEQARGKSVDKRTDIWAFGVVLYELLTGERLFTGEDITEVLASVVKDKPDLSKVPAKVRSLLEHCLEKNPKKRLRDIGDMSLLLESPVAAAGVKTSSPWMSSKIAWAAAALFLISTAALGLMVLRQKPAQPAGSVRFDIPPPEGGTLSFVALSPNGSKLAMIVQGANGQKAIWLRSLDSVGARRIVDAQGANALAWSPDSRYLAFNGSGKIQKIDVSGGAPETVCSYQPPFNGLAWGQQDVILFSAGLVINRVSASGGEVTQLTRLNPKREDLGHGGPIFLPDGRHFLYIVVARTENTGIYAGSIDEKPEQQNGERLTDSQAAPIYAPTNTDGGGYVLFLRGDTLMARAFDAKRLQFTDAGVRVADSIGTNGSFQGLFSASDTGIIATSSGGSESRQLTWFDRQGKVLSKVGEPGRRDEMDLSPDETRVAEGRVDEQGTWSVWVMDLAKGGSSRFTFEGNGGGLATWSPDGRQIIYASAGGRSADMFRRPADGASKEEVLFHSDSLKSPMDWSPDGKWLLYDEQGKDSGLDLWALPDPGGPPGLERKPVPYLVTPFVERQAKFSPDGKWVAYSSNESGTYEVYVRPFPSSSGGKWLVSNGGGAEVRWRHDGKELFFVTPDGTLMAADVRTDPTFQSGIPKPLFRTTILGGLGGAPTASWRYAVSRDGQRFLINSATEERNATPVVVTTQWQESLKK